MANVTLTLDMTVLGLTTQVTYQYLKTDEKGGSRFLVIPQKVTSENWISIQELINQFKELWKNLSGEKTDPVNLPSVSDITAQLSDSPESSAPDKINIRINTLYLYIDTSAYKSVFEYALCCEVEQKIIPESIKAFNITSLKFAIWDTQNKRILHMMGIIDPSKMLTSDELEEENSSTLTSS